MTKDKVQILCVVENWRTNPTTRATAERQIAAGFPDCTMGEHRIVSADEQAK